MRPYQKSLALVLALTLVAAALGAVEPLALKAVVDELTAGHTLRAVIYAIAGLALVLLVRDGVAAVLDTNAWRTRIGVHQSITRATVERLHSLPLAYHSENGVGAVMTKMDRGINGAVAAFADLAFSVLPAIVYLVMAVTIMLRLSPWLSLLVLAFAPLAPAIGVVASKEQTRRERGLMDRWTRIFARFNEVLSGIVVVKSFAMEEVEKRRFLAGVEEANGLVLAGVRRDAGFNAAKSITGAMARVTALALGAFLVTRGQITVGTLVAFLGYIAGVFGPVQGLTGTYQTLRKGTVALETVFSILDAQDSLGDAPDARDCGPLRGDVELDDVTFGYREGAPVLRGLSLRVAAGETVALVGPSGGGKSTLVRLLMRLYDPTGGSIKVDDFDLRTLKQRSLREQIATVIQEPILFSGSIRDNITFGSPEATAEQIEAAARAANAHEFIVAHPQGYDTKLGDRGGTLSLGQKQRITIARALLRDPAILILDEATSALDGESQAQVQEALERLKEGRTTFVIAHRLSTVKSCDRILVLAGGRVTEDGQHEELLRAGGYYAKLVRLQSGGVLHAA